MKTINSISGGQTSAYIAAHYPADYNLFALVTIEDNRCLWMKGKDEKIRQEISDRIGKEFIGTAEDDVIIYTMLDLEQFIGTKVTFVAGIPFEKVITDKGGWLPNKLHRYCTTHMKLEPMFYWWAKYINEIVEMRIGFRANEVKRMLRTLEKTNDQGLLSFHATFEKHKNGNNKWIDKEWQKPVFPLIKNPTFKDEIVEFWKNKPVRFAKRNNCVGCFHRHPILLKKQFLEHPDKMNWFMEQEKIKMNKDKRATWRSDVSYEQIKNHKLQVELFADEDFLDCDSGHCGI